MKRNYKVPLMLLLIFVLILNLGVPIYSQAENETQAFEGISYDKTGEIRVIVDGNQLIFDTAPIIVEGRTLVPMRAIFEALGLSVQWNESDRTVKGTGEGIVVQLGIGSNKAIVNGVEQILDVPAMLIGGRTMVPLRFLSSSLGYNVVWIEESQLILLSKGPIVEWRYGGFEAAEPYKEYEYKYINGVATTEYRYTGTLKQVELVDLFRKDGSIIPNVPDFMLKNYGFEWSQISPYVGKTWWIHIDQLEETTRNSKLFAENLEKVYMDDLEELKTSGGYLRITVEEHLFSLDMWRKLINDTKSEISKIEDEKLLNKVIIDRFDTILKISIEDGSIGYIPLKTLKGTVIEPDKNEIYTYLDKDPTILFKWDKITWNRLERDQPWVGMSSEMLLVKMKEIPDQSAEIKTEFSVLELWVYQHEYGDSVYYFDDGVLVNMW